MRSTKLKVGNKIVEITESSSHKFPGKIGWVMAQNAGHADRSVSVDVDSDDQASIDSRYTRLSAAIHDKLGIRLTAARIERLMQEEAPSVGTD